MKECLLGKQTCRQLAARHRCHRKTILRRLKSVAPPSGRVADLPGRAVVVLDTTCFGRGFGVMVLKDAATGRNLLAAPIKQETVALYQAAIEQLLKHHCRVQAIVCDGRRGLFGAFGGIPVPMCQFHQIAILRRHPTRNPKLPAARELWRLASRLPRSKQEAFCADLDAWHAKWSPFLEERTLSPATRRSRYTHRRLRSAFLSLKRNLPWLFTCLRHPSLQIPNTTNLLDGLFADLKNKLRNHNGLSKNRRSQLVLHFLSPSLIHHFVP